MKVSHTEEGEYEESRKGVPEVERSGPRALSRC